MAAIYGSQWRNGYGDGITDAGELTLAADTWARSLGDLSPEQIAAGIQQCSRAVSGWPPSLPEFRARCLSIPSVQDAAIRIEDEGDPFALLMRRSMNTYRLRNVGADSAEKMIRDAYIVAKEHLMAGGELPAMPVARIEGGKPEHEPASPEVAQKAIATINAMLHP